MKYGYLRALFVFILIVCFDLPFFAFASSVSVPGTFPWYAQSKGNVTVELWGAGGGGGSGYKYSAHNASGFGGGGGGYASKTFSVNPGDEIDLTVGARGATGGGGGGASNASLNGNFIFAAGGGGGGASGIQNSQGTNGSVGGGPGGGDPGTYNGLPGGGGGSGAGGDTNLSGSGAGNGRQFQSDGQNPRATSGGAGANGGAGGASGWTGWDGSCTITSNDTCGGGAPASPGTAPGGGGGGSDIGTGAAGANGQAAVTFTPTNSAPVGSLDSATCDSITGWSYDPDNANQNISVKIYADGPEGSGTLVGTTNTGGSRSDVAAANGGDGATSGFSFSTPTSLKDGATHSIYAYGVDTAGGPDAALSGSGKTISCTTQVNHPPTAPTISGPQTGSTNQTLSFSINSTDPDGDQVEYLIDWGDGSGFQNYDSAYHPSGQSVTITKSWSSSGSKTFSVEAEDTYGAMSGASSYTVTISDTGNPSVSLSADRTTVYSTDANQNVTLTWGAANVTGCVATGDWSGTKNTSGSESVSISKNSTFYISCVSSSGLVRSSAAVSYVIPQNTAPTGGSISVSLSVNSTNVTPGSYDKVTSTASESGGTLTKHGFEICPTNGTCPSGSGGASWQNVGENGSPSNPDTYSANPQFSSAGTYYVRAYASDGQSTVYSGNQTVTVAQSTTTNSPGNFTGATGGANSCMGNFTDSHDNGYLSGIWLPYMTQVTWSVTGAQSCSSSWGGSVSGSGSTDVNMGTNGFSLSCGGESYSVSCHNTAPPTPPAPPPPSFTLSPSPATLNIQSIGNIEAATSSVSTVMVNAGPGFSASSVTLSASSSDLPSDAMFVFDGNQTSLITLTSCSGGSYCSQTSGLIGTKFQVFVPHPLTESSYSITITGTPSGGGSGESTTITLTPGAINPNYKEY